MQYSRYSHVNVLKSRLHLAARQLLSQDQRNRIKSWLRVVRKRGGRFHVLAHGQYTAHDLISELRGQLPEDFDILMVHSAYERLSPMYIGAAHEVVGQLIELCGTNRTLAMPAFMLGGRSYNPAGYYASHVFDAKKTVSEVGLITEIFRRTPGVKRSLHPTHSVCALGPLADALTATHHLASTRTGRGTPFEVMAQRKTIIVGLGMEYHRCLTQIHSAEDMLGNEFPIKIEAESVPVTLVDPSGGRFTYELRINQTPKTMNLVLLRSLLSKDELMEWKFKGTPMFMTFADKVTSQLLTAAEMGITVYGSRKS